MTIDKQVVYSDIDKLYALESCGAISIGLDKNYANTLWCNTTVTGKILNMLTPIFVIGAVVVFLFAGILKGFLSVLFIGCYVIIVQKIAVMYVKRRLLFDKEGYFFNDAYTKLKATIRDNSTGQVIKHPVHWVRLIMTLDRLINGSHNNNPSA